MSKKQKDLKDAEQEVNEGTAVDTVAEAVDEPAPESETDEAPLPEPPPEKGT